MPWPPRRSNRTAELELQKEKHELQMAVIGLRRQLNTQANYVSALEQVVRQRFNRIDALNETIDRLRQQNQQLGLENHCLTALLIAPAVPTAEITAR